MATLDYNYLAQLVLHAQFGDSDAFAELYAATYQKQYYFAYHFLKDEYLAQDALQETYILALRNIARLQDPSVVVAWLNQINFRVCYNMRKKQRRYDEEMSEFQNASLEQNTVSDNPEDEIVHIESKQYLINQILNLPFTESQVILLKYYQNQKVEEIARFLDVSRSSVNRYLRSGRLRLQKILQEEVS